MINNTKLNALNIQYTRIWTNASNMSCAQCTSNHVCANSISAAVCLRCVFPSTWHITATPGQLTTDTGLFIQSKCDLQISKKFLCIWTMVFSHANNHIVKCTTDKGSWKLFQFQSTQKLSNWLFCFEYIQMQHRSRCNCYFYYQGIIFSCAEELSKLVWLCVCACIILRQTVLYSYEPHLYRNVIYWWRVCTDATWMMYSNISICSCVRQINKWIEYLLAIRGWYGIYSVLRAYDCDT